MKNLQKYLEDNLTMAQWNALPLAMGLTRTKTTKIINDPAIANMDEARSLAIAIDLDLPELIMEYGVGTKKVTLHQVNEMLHSGGYGQLGIVHHQV